jgi:geranylgeranyl pyrophosphate synthase
MSVEEYLYMNYLKSGSLFEAAGALGALSSSGNLEDVNNFSNFGKNFGNAYQIRDDIIDTFNPKSSEQTPNNDLLNGDASLILLYALKSEKITIEDRETLLSRYQGETKELNISEIHRIYEYTGALERSIHKMETYTEKAKEILKKYPDSEAKASLSELLEEYSSKFITNLERDQANFI